jgi:outer membrane protein assembly factor BamE (lipoprotein component of BamABCDE complex)
MQAPMKLKNFFLLFLPIAFLTSCNAKNFYQETYNDNNSKQMTLGVAQKELHKGMAQDEVATVIGSPNIVTQDKDSKETWIYDKIATQVRSSGTGGLVLFCQTGADYVNRTDISQQTLTVVIKFDNEKKIDGIAYHSSKF